jgi:hypothetical protein
MNRKIIILFLMLNTFCFGQNRVNDKLPQITKTNGQLLNAFGWLKNNSGQWISRKNKIPFDLGKDQKALEVVAKPSGTKTPSEDNSLYISPREAFFPPTLATSFIESSLNFLINFISLFFSITRVRSPYSVRRFLKGIAVHKQPVQI